jgi:biotin transport system substrate-specific component
MENSMAEITLANPRITAHSPARHLLGQTALAVAGSALVALCAHVAIPLAFTPVPLSMAPWAVLFLGLTLGPATAFASLCLYLTEGAAGLPVFSPLGPGGILQLLGPTGGYLLSYPFAAALAGYLYRRRRRSFTLGIFSAAAASLLILLVGAAWLKLLTHMNIRVLLDQAVLPFLPGDALKVFAAAGAAKLVDTVRLRRQLKEFLSQNH